MGSARTRRRALRRRQRVALFYAFAAGYFVRGGLETLSWWTVGAVVIAAGWMWIASGLLIEGGPSDGR